MNEDNCQKFNGRFRGTVITNIDPNQTGRLLVQVPDVAGAVPMWATSASPLAGKQMGIYAVPLTGDGVWVEFENGDAQYPIWTGSWRGSSVEVPPAAIAAPPATPPLVLQSIAQNKIIISSIPGDCITLETLAGPAGPSIKITSLGIIISDGAGAMITLQGGVVTINQGALIIK